MKCWRAVLGLVITITLISIVAACAPNHNPNSVVLPDAAGFLSGFWHGCIAWIVLVFSLFGADANIYEVHNTGTGYNFGFLISVSLGITGLIVLIVKSIWNRC